MIEKIWKNLDKSSFEKESAELIKRKKKADLYSLVMTQYEANVGKQISRSTVRRCVNTYIKVNSQG